MTQQYETICVIKSDIQGDRLNSISEKIKKVLADQKAENVKQNDWGIRKLAYTIENHKTAHYFQFVYEGVGALVSELERQLSYDDAILRYLTVNTDRFANPAVKPDNFQFAKAEYDAPFHPFGGGYGDRDRGDRGGERRSFRKPAQEQQASEGEE